MSRAASGRARVVGRYALYDEIASGGMASVHFGRLLGPVGFARTVAIKRLHPQYAKDPEFVSMFLDEARLAARVRHPNVVPTLDVVAEAGELFLVMDYVEGESLSRLVRAMKTRGEHVPHDVVVAVLCGVLQGLHAAHEARDEGGNPLDIVHRDVSPQNILVGVDGVPRVLDFGIAKAAGRAQTTRDGQIKGKVSYMPPEQIQGAVTRRTDVYSVAVVLWETLVGRRLFEGDSPVETLNKVIHALVPPPSTLASSVPTSFDEVVLRGLARDPRDRYATAKDMARALEACARPATMAELAEWVRKVAVDSLTQRADVIADIESQSMNDAEVRGALEGLASRPIELDEFDVPKTSADVPRAIAQENPNAEAQRSSRRTGGVAVVFVALAAIIVFLLVRGREATSAPSPGREAPTVTASASASASASAIASAAVSASSVNPSSSAPPPPSASVSAAPSASSPLAPKPLAMPKKPSCDPPWFYDAHGKKVYKEQCL